MIDEDKTSSTSRSGADPTPVHLLSFLLSDIFHFISFLLRNCAQIGHGHTQIANIYDGYTTSGNG